MNSTGESQFDQARIEWAIRLRYSPMPELSMSWVASNLNAFRIGELRVMGKIWEIMMERDGDLGVNADKRASELSGLDWKVVSDGSAEGEEHAGALTYFYKNLRVTRALEQDAAGGVSELLYQMASAHSYFYSAHEVLLRIDNGAGREVTAELRQTPVWFFESRRGYLGYLKHIFDVYGEPCREGEWLTCVGSGWMRSLCLAYVLKNVALRDWILFCARYGSGFLEGITDAQKSDPAWEEAREALQSMANDGVVLHNHGVSMKFLDSPAKSMLPFEPLVEHVNRLYAKCYRGIDLATGSRGSERGQRGAVGASVQKEELGIFAARDAVWATGYLNERLDRPVIRFLFDREPRAWMAVTPRLDESAAMDLECAQALVPMGLRISLAEAYKRFRWKRPEAGEECLRAVQQNFGQDEQDEQDGNKKEASRENSAGGTPTGAVETTAVPNKSLMSAADSPGNHHSTGISARTINESDLTAGAIGAGAKVQSASPNLPDGQVDAANFWSAGAVRRGES